MKHLIFFLTALLALGAAACRKSGTEVRIVPYREGDLWGFAKPGGAVVVKPAYMNAYLYEDGYGRIGAGELTGLVSPEGKVLAEPKYSYISDFRHGRAVFSMPDGKHGYLDEQGKEVIPPQYEQAFPFGNEAAAVLKDSQYHLIRRDGSLIKTIGKLIPMDLDPMGATFMETDWIDPGYMLVAEPDSFRMGLIDLNGNQVLPTVYENLSAPMNGVLLASQDNKYQLLRTDGSPVLPQLYTHLYRLDTDRILAQQDDNTYGVINHKGEILIPFEFNSLVKGPGDTFIAFKDEAAGVIDAKGNTLIPFEYSAFYTRHNRLVAYNKAGKAGILDTGGQVLLPFDYDNIDPLRPNRFLVDKGGKRGLVDDKGNTLLPIEYNIDHMEIDAREYNTGDERPATAIILFKGIKGTLFDTDGKKLSDKSWLYCGYPDRFGLTYATDANGRDNIIGPNGRIYAKDPELKKVSVNNVQALFEAIADDTEITLEDGRYDLGTVQGGSKFAGVYDFTEYGMEDRSMLIRQVRNLHIKAKNPGKAQLITSYAFVPVLRLEECRNVSLHGLSMGHDVQPGLCEGAVLVPVNCYYFAVNNCDLYGSGTFGIESDGSSFIGLYNSTVRECTRGLLYLQNSYTVHLENSTMKDSGGDHMVHIYASNDIRFEGVQFTGNNAPKEYGPYEFFRIQDAYQAVSLRNCTFSNCSTDYYATFEEGLTEENVNRTGLKTAKGLWLQKEPHRTPYQEAWD